MQKYKNKSSVGRAWTAASFARVNGQGLSWWTWTAAYFAGVKAQSDSCWRMDSNVLCKIIRTWH